MHVHGRLGSNNRRHHYRLQIKLIETNEIKQKNKKSYIYIDPLSPLHPLLSTYRRPRRRGRHHSLDLCERLSSFQLFFALSILL